MPSTTREEFNSVTQSGSSASWSNLSNLVYPETGEATANMGTGSGSRTNNVFFALHEGVAGIPNGSSFDGMSLQYSYKKSGTFQGAADVDLFGTTSLSSATVWTRSNISATYTTNLSGSDKAFWRLTAYSDTQIIDYLKDGTLSHQLWFTEGNSVSSGILAHLNEISLLVTYTTIRNERGAVLIPL